jgi:hypothetical protein
MLTARSRTLPKVVIGLALFIVPAVLIKGVVEDQIDKANTAAGFQNIPANPGDIDDSQSLYRTENFAAALKALEEHAGKNPELLEVGVLPYMAEFQIKDGQKAKGFRYYAKNGEMGESKVKIVGPGSIDGSRFPYETLSAGSTEKLAAGVAEQDGALRVTNMTIRRNIVGGDLAWSVNSESDDRTGIVFQADPDGSGLDDPTKRAIERNAAQAGAPAASATKEATAQADCLQEAAGDAAKLQACVD